MSEKYHRFTFCPDDYQKSGSAGGAFPEAEEADLDALWRDLGAFLQLALKNGYRCHVWHDGYTYVVDYNYADEGLAGASLQWVGENEYVGSYEEESEGEDEKEC